MDGEEIQETGAGLLAWVPLVGAEDMVSEFPSSSVPRVS